MRTQIPILLSLSLIVSCLAGCVEVEPEPPLDEEGEVIKLPGPYDDWLVVTRLEPEAREIATTPTLRIRFDTYLEDDLLLDFAAVAMRSGGLLQRGRVRYVMSEKTLVFEPLAALVPDLTYHVELDPERLESVTGAPLREQELASFVVREELESSPPPAPAAPRWATIAEIFARKCHSCHRDPTWQLNPLTHRSLVGGRSDQIDRVLVRPHDPPDSYLMHKILLDYPDRRFTVQPPPWSDAQPLTAQEIRLIERWIEAGAPGPDSQE